MSIRKIDNETVESIVRRYARGESMTRMAAEYGIHRGQLLRRCRNLKGSTVWTTCKLDHANSVRQNQLAGVPAAV